MDNKILLVCIALLTGCATFDKAMVPVDEGVNSTKTTFQKVGHSVSESVGGMGDGVSNLKAGFMESSFMKVFLSDESVLKNRQKNYVTWSAASKYKANGILMQKLEGTEINNPDMLKSGEKMQILKEYFFDLKKTEHANNFSEKYKKPEFSEFLTDRENIEKIHEYKTALLKSEHQWRKNLKDTQKQIAQLMLSTLYNSPALKYVSYDPYKEELFLSVESTNEGFREKIKIEAEKGLAKNIKAQINRVEPYVFFEFNDDVLSFVGINVKYANKTYVCDVVDQAYVRQSDVVFTSGDINLDTLNVGYSEILKNIKPPKWFNSLESDGDNIIGYGEGISKDDAKKEAFKEIAMSIETTVSTKLESEQIVSGSTYANLTKSSTEQTVEAISIQGSKVIKVEKKDRLWFVAILYDK